MAYAIDGASPSADGRDAARGYAAGGRDDHR